MTDIRNLENTLIPVEKPLYKDWINRALSSMWINRALSSMPNAHAICPKTMGFAYFIPGLNKVHNSELVNDLYEMCKWRKANNKAVLLDDWLKLMDPKLTGSFDNIQKQIDHKQVKNLVVFPNFNPAFNYCLLKQTNLSNVNLYMAVLRDMDSQTIKLALSNLEPTTVRKAFDQTVDLLKQKKHDN